MRYETVNKKSSPLVIRKNPPIVWELLTNDALSLFLDDAGGPGGFGRGRRDPCRPQRRPGGRQEDEPDRQLPAPDHDSGGESLSSPFYFSYIEFTIIKSGNITVPMQAHTKALMFRFFLQINILISLIYTDMLIQIYIV